MHGLRKDEFSLRELLSSSQRLHRGFNTYESDKLLLPVHETP